jgi:hypothetical protein
MMVAPESLSFSASAFGLGSLLFFPSVSNMTIFAAPTLGGVFLLPFAKAVVLANYNKIRIKKKIQKGQKVCV